MPQWKSFVSACFSNILKDFGKKTDGEVFPPTNNFVRRGRVDKLKEANMTEADV